MRLRLALGLLVAALLVGALVRRSGVGARELAHYAPAAYVERADRFIAAGYLVADCSGRAPRLDARLDGAPEEEVAWYRESYLAADVARFNADPEGSGWTFVLDDDCRLRGVDPVVHAIDLPFARRRRWLGDILYGGGAADAVLRSARRSITLRRSERTVLPREQATTAVGAAENVLEEGVVLLHFAGGRGQPAASLFHVGDAVVAQNRVREGRPESVRLMGHALPLGRMARLETGDWLHLEAAVPRRVEETFVHLGGEALEAASAVQLRNERIERRTDDPGLGLVVDPVRDSTFPFLDLVAQSLDTVLAVLPEARAEELTRAFDVQLTLERAVQLELSRVFREAAEEVRRERSLEPFAAGLTVMDGRSGEILALATYPDAADLEDADFDARDRRRLVRNQNFARHPIGSAGKPFFFAAIADAYPELLDLEIAGHGAERHHRDLLECQIPTGYHLLEGHFDERIDFRQALEMSCNKYTLELATLALALDGRAPGTSGVPADPEVEWPLPGKRSGIFLAGRELGFAPDLGYVHRQEGEVDREPPADEEDATESEAAVRCSTLGDFELVRYRAPLERLTGAATYRGRRRLDLPQEPTVRQLEQGYLTNRFDLSPWAPLLEALTADVDGDAAWKVRAALQPISPDRVNLAFNQITELRADYVSLFLGGGSSIWTNVQLAEAMSRLVTDRAVEARLAARVIPREGDAPDAAADAAAASEPPRVGLRPAAREAVLEGLERVVLGGRGTAVALRDELEAVRRRFPDDRVALYAKTGSPVLERLVSGTTAEALERLVARSRLRWEGGGLVVRVGDRTTPYRRWREAGRDDYLRALASALATDGSPSRGRTFVTIRDVVDDFVAGRRAGRHEGAAGSGPLELVGGALRLDRTDGLFGRRILRQMGSVLVLSLVRQPGRGAGPPDGTAPDARVVTAVLYLEVGPDSRVAVAAAEKVLPQLARFLEDGRGATGRHGSS